MIKSVQSGQIIVSDAYFRLGICLCVSVCFPQSYEAFLSGMFSNWFFF